MKVILPVAQPASAKVPLEQDPALKQWLRFYYIKWLEVCENQRWIQAWRDPKYPTVLVPFLPFGYVPALPFHHLLTTLIATHLCSVENKLPHRDGFKGRMDTIIEEDSDPAASPGAVYRLEEEIVGGIIKTFELVGSSAAPFRAVPSKTALQVVTYRKTVSTSFLRDVYELHEKWLADGDNALYLIGFVSTLLRAIREEKAKIDPKPALYENLMRILGRVQLGDIDVWEVARSHVHLVPNLVIEGRGGDLRLDLGGKYTVVLAEDAFLAFLEGLKFANDLPSFTSFLIGYLARGMQSGWIKLDGLRWMSRILAWLLGRRIRALPGKVQILAKILADPYRILLASERQALLIRFQKGLPQSIENVTERIEASRRKRGAGPGWGGARDLWQAYVSDHEFVHLAAQVSIAGGRARLSSPMERLDFYPKNDFAKFLIRQGELGLFFNLLFPFLSA